MYQPDAMAASSAADLRRFADGIRLRSVRMVAPHGFGYLGQALSSAELFATLHLTAYRPDADQLVISPGHYVIAAFASAAAAGRLDEERLETYGTGRLDLEAIGTERSPAVDLTCGSLGLGLSGAVGFALSNRMGATTTRVSSRSSATASSRRARSGRRRCSPRTTGWTAWSRCIDANDSQVDGPVSSITTLEPMAAKWEAFGWEAFDVDGHDVAALTGALESALESASRASSSREPRRPTGLSVLPPDADGHFIKLPEPLARAAVAELEARLA